MEKLIEDYKKTLELIIEKYSNYEDMTVNDFINKYAELKQFSIQGVSCSTDRCYEDGSENLRPKEYNCLDCGNDGYYA